MAEDADEFNNTDAFFVCVAIVNSYYIFKSLNMCKDFINNQQQ